MSRLLFSFFIITYFMPSLIIIKGLSLSDLLLVLLILSIFKNGVKLNNIQKKLIVYWILILAFYTIIELLHLFLKGQYIIVPDKIVYYYVLLIIFIFGSINISSKNFIKISKISIYINAIIFPYIFLLGNLSTYHKLTSLFIKPNQLALFLLLSPILLFILFFIERKKLDYLNRLSIFIFFLYVPMLATASKSGLLMLLLCHFILLGFLYRKRFIIKSLLIGVIFVLISLSSFNLKYFIVDYLPKYFPQFNRVALFLYASDIKYEDNFRNINNKEGLEIFKNNPIVGVGFGGDELRTSTRHEIHNTYIRLLAVSGLIGTFVFITYIFYFLLIIIKFTKNLLFILLNIPIFIFGFYHDIFTSKYFFIQFGFLMYLYRINQHKGSILEK